jgi:hypothetical protein
VLNGPNGKDRHVMDKMNPKQQLIKVNGSMDKIVIVPTERTVVIEQL